MYTNNIATTDHCFNHFKLNLKEPTWENPHTQCLPLLIATKDLTSWVEFLGCHPLEISVLVEDLLVWVYCQQDLHALVIYSNNCKLLVISHMITQPLKCPVDVQLRSQVVVILWVVNRYHHHWTSIYRCSYCRFTCSDLIDVMFPYQITDFHLIRHRTKLMDNYPINTFLGWIPVSPCPNCIAFLKCTWVVNRYHHHRISIYLCSYCRFTCSDLIDVIPSTHFSVEPM